MTCLVYGPPHHYAETYKKSRVNFRKWTDELILEDISGILGRDYESDIYGKEMLWHIRRSTGGKEQ